jgi:hypothetical protein
MADDDEVFQLPTLWRRTTHGGVQAYESRVEGSSVLRWTWTKPVPRRGKDGEIVVPKKQPTKTPKEPLVAEVKWEGKANEKTAHETAITKAKSECKKKIDRGYTLEEPEIEPLPYEAKAKAPKKPKKDEAATEAKDKKPPKQKKIPARALEELKTPMLLQKYGDNPLPLRACISVKRNGVCGFYRVLTDDIISRHDNQPYRHFDHLKPALRRVVELAEARLRAQGYEPRGVDTLIVKAVHMELDVPDEMGLSFQAKTEVLRAQKTIHALNDSVVGYIFDLGDQSVVPFCHRYSAMYWAYCQWHEENVPSMLDTEVIRLVQCVTVDTDASMGKSLGLFFPDAEDGEAASTDAFAIWLAESYDARAERWEPVPPLSLEDVRRWAQGERQLSAEERVRLLHRWIVDGLGQEGSVIRDLDGYYQGNDYRSAAVLKHKDYEDEEAVVVGYEGAKGAHAGAIVFVMRSLVSGQEYTSVFSSEMGMSVADRIALKAEYDAGEKLVSDARVYTVRFQERYDSGIPQFPTIVGECPPGTKTILGRPVEELAEEALSAHDAEVAATEAAKAEKVAKKVGSRKKGKS